MIHSSEGKSTYILIEKLGFKNTTVVVSNVITLKEHKAPRNHCKIFLITQKKLSWMFQFHEEDNNTLTLINKVVVFG